MTPRHKIFIKIPGIACRVESENISKWHKRWNKNQDLGEVLTKYH